MESSKGNFARNQGSGIATPDNTSTPSSSGGASFSDANVFVLTKVSEVGQTVAGLKESVLHLTAEGAKSTSELSALRLQIAEQRAFLKGASLVAGGAITVVGFFLVLAWSEVIKPGLSHAIVEQMESQITQQVNEAVAKESAVRQKK